MIGLIQPNYNNFMNFYPMYQQMPPQTVAQMSQMPQTVGQIQQLGALQGNQNRTDLPKYQPPNYSSTNQNYQQYPQAFPRIYLSELQGQILACPYFAVNNLNRDFVSTKGFSIVFRRSHLPVGRPIARRALTVRLFVV